MSAPDMLALASRSNTLRSARAQVRADLGAGRVTVGELLADLPECVAGVLLVDLLRWQRFLAQSKLRRLNMLAMRDGVNLCMPAGCAGERTRGWLARNAPTGRTW